MRVAKAFKKLNENTALYFAKQRKDGKTIIAIVPENWDGRRWAIDPPDLAAPYIFELQQNLYVEN